MDIEEINNLIDRLENHPDLQPDQPLKPQLPKLFTPTLWGPGLIPKKSLKGRVCALLARDSEKRIFAAFQTALKQQTEITALTLKLVDELEGEANPNSPLFNHTNPSLEQLKTDDETLNADASAAINTYSLLQKTEGVAEVSPQTFQELFSMKKATTATRRYWTQFLEKFPEFKHAQFSQHQKLLGSARNRAEKFAHTLAGKSIEEADSALEAEANRFAETVGQMRPGTSWMMSGSYGKKQTPFRKLSAFIQAQPTYIQDLISEMLNTERHFDDPSLFIKTSLHQEIRGVLDESQTETLQYLDGITKNLETLAKIRPSKEVLELLTLLTHTPGIDSYLITTICFSILTAMKFIPEQKLIETLRFLTENGASLSQDETLATIEKLVNPILSEHIEPLLENTLHSFQRNVLSPGLSEALFEALPAQDLLKNSPYWIKLEKKQDGTYTAYIYSSGHALNYHTHEDSHIQWPMRISFIPEEKLSANFFKRLLEHTFKTEYDPHFTSKTEDLFSQEGTFASLRGPRTNQDALDWVPFHETFDTEFELLQAMTSGHAKKASLYMHIYALRDLPHPLSSQLKTAYPILKKEYLACQDYLTEEERLEVEWTLKEVAARIDASPDKEPSLFIKQLKNVLIKTGLSSEHIMQYEATLKWLLGNDVVEALDTLLQAAEAAKAQTNLEAIKSGKGFLEKYEQQNQVHTKALSLFEALEESHLDQHTVILEAKRSFSKLEQSALSGSDLKRMQTQLRTLERCFKGSKEVSELRKSLCKRVSIEKAFAPKIGIVQQLLSNLYMQTLFHLLNVTIALGSWMSPFAMVFLYNALIGILPEPLKTFIDSHVKQATRRCVEKAFFLTLNLLVKNGQMAQADVDALFLMKAEANHFAASINGKKRISFLTGNPARALSRFCNENDTTYENNTLTFKPFNLSFRIENDTAFSAQFPGYFIAKNQEDEQVKHLVSYLILENDAGDKKVLLPSNNSFQALSWRILEQLGPLAGFAGNFMTFSSKVKQSSAKTHAKRQQLQAQANELFDQLSSGYPYKAIIPVKQAFALLKSPAFSSNEFHAAKEQINTLELMFRRLDLWTEEIPALKNLLKERLILESHDLFSFTSAEIAVDAPDYYADDNNLGSLLHRAVSEALSGNSRGATKATDQFIHLLQTEAPLNTDYLEKTLIPLLLAPNFLADAAILRVRQRLLAALQEKMVRIPTRDPLLNSLAAAALYQDLLSMQNLPHRRDQTAAEFLKEEWMLYQSFKRHADAGVNPLLALTPQMANRYLALERHFEQTSSNQALLFLRDMVYAPFTIPVRTYVGVPGAETPSLHGITEYAENEVPSSRLAQHAYQTARSVLERRDLSSLNWEALREEVAIPPPLSKQSIVTDFLSYYAAARGDLGQEARTLLQQQLLTHKGGWDLSTRTLVNLLASVANPPLGIQKWFFPKNRDPNETIEEFVTKLMESAATLQTGKLAAKPFQELATWVAKGPLLGLIGGKTAFYPWIGMPIAALATKAIHVYSSRLQVYEEPAAAPDYLDVLEEQDGCMRAAFEEALAKAAPLEKYSALKGHRNALKKALEDSRQTLLDLTNPKRALPIEHAKVTYEELLTSFFKGSLKFLAEEVGHDPHVLQHALAAQINGETWLQEFDTHLIALRNNVAVAWAARPYRSNEEALDYLKQNHLNPLR